MFLIGSISLFILGIFFRGFLYRSIFNNFKMAYKAYDVSLIEKLQRVPEVFGWGFLLIIFMAPLMGLKNKKVLRITIPLLINIVVTSSLLWRVLQMNYHQYYLILVQMIVLLLIGAFGISEWIVKKPVGSGILIVALINMGFMLMPSVGSLLPARALFSELEYMPKKRSDINEIKRLVEDLNDIEEQEENAHFYVLSSSGVLNSSIISSAGFPDKVNAVPNMYSTHDVDLRDGFPAPFFDADYVLVADPIQLHLPNGTQEVVRYLAYLMLDSESVLGDYYELKKEYSLENSVKVKLYKRTRVLERDVYEELKRYFEALYPTVPELFANRLNYPDPFYPINSGDKLILGYNNKDLHTQFEANKEQWSSYGEGFLVYGPYKRLEKGRYSIEYKVSGNENDKESIIGFVDVYSSGKILAKKEIFGGDNVVEVDDLNISEIYDNVELRIFVTVPGITFEKIVVTRK